jgi:hypothetical protein
MVGVTMSVESDVSHRMAVVSAAMAAHPADVGQDLSTGHHSGERRVLVIAAPKRPAGARLGRRRYDGAMKRAGVVVGVLAIGFAACALNAGPGRTLVTTTIDPNLPGEVVVTFPPTDPLLIYFPPVTNDVCPNSSPDACGADAGIPDAADTSPSDVADAGDGDVLSDAPTFDAAMLDAEVSDAMRCCWAQQFWDPTTVDGNGPVYFCAPANSPSVRTWCDGGTTD